MPGKRNRSVKMNEARYQVEVEEVSPVLRKVSVQVPKEEVEKRLEDSFRKLQKRAKVPGFRPGKAPLSVIKTRFRKSVIEDLEEDLPAEKMREVIREKGLKAVAITKVEDGKYREGEDFRFCAHVEVLPEFEVKGLDSLEVPPVEADVTDEEVEAVIQRLRESQAVYKPVDRESRQGDLLEISFRSYDGEKLLHEAENTSYELLGKSALGEEFEKELTGRKAGEELSFQVSYPDDHEIADVKGKTIRYEISIKSVKEKVLPEVDDEFAKSVGPFESVDEMKERIREDLKKEKERLGRQKQEGKVVEQLLQANPIEVPSSLVEEEMNRLLYDTYRRLWDQGMRFDISQLDTAKIREKYREDAEKNVRLSLVLNRLAQEEGIEVTDDDIKSEMERMGKEAGVSEEDVRRYYEEENRMESLKNRLLERKVFDVLLKKAKVVAEKEEGKESEGPSERETGKDE
ncbi:MAG: trigger factor [Deltaproteobacteria bacterium]|nr:MAG: trigger factor [Deltaproteobacteria bacterium]